MLGHVYEIEGGLGRGQSPFHDGGGRTHKGVDGPVGGGAGVNVQKLDPGHARNGVRDGIDDLEEVSVDFI